MSIGGGPGADQTAGLWGLMGGERDERRPVQTKSRKHWQECFILFYFILFLPFACTKKNRDRSVEYIPDAMKNAMAWIMKTITVS